MVKQIIKWLLALLKTKSMPRKGDTGQDVKIIQEALGLKADGIYGPATEKAVKGFQSKNGLVADGIAGPKTMEVMFPSTDLQEGISWIEPYPLPEKEYCSSLTDKEYIFIHHTAGWNNPYKTIDHWGRDKRGRIATQFVIGGPHPMSSDLTYDGVILECFGDKNWAYHLGKNGSSHMHSHSVGIEVNNFGYLTKDGDEYYTYANTKVHPNNVTDLGKKWRGRQYWHAYSDEQIESLRKLILHISEIHGIDISIGLKDWLSKEDAFDAFGYKDDAFYGKVKGILSHSNTRKDKTDMYPCPRLVEMLKNL